MSSLSMNNLSAGSVMGDCFVDILGGGGVLRRAAVSVRDAASRLEMATWNGVHPSSLLHRRLCCK